MSLKAPSLQESISRSETLEELESVLRSNKGFKHVSYRNYIYPTFGGEAVGPNDVSYFKAYEDGLDISSMCFDILSWDEERILFIIGIGMTLDLTNDMIVAAKVPQPESFDYWITKREFVEKYSVDIVCPICSKVNRIMPDYSVHKCEHVVASHVFGELKWHCGEVEKRIDSILSMSIFKVSQEGTIDEICEDEDDDGVCHYWSVLHEHVLALKSAYPQIKFMECDAFGLGYCDVAGFAFLPSEVISTV